MANKDKTIPSRILDFFKNMDKGKRKRLIILVSIAIVVAVATSVILNQKTYTVLYSGMEPGDTAQVLSLLSEMGVDAKAEGEDTVLITGNEVDTIRMQLASQGYPSSGLNYDIYQSASGLGVTDAEKKVYYQYQLQENLRKTIVQMDKVKAAVVNIDLGKDSSFVLSDDNKDATASIMLTLEDGKMLDGSEVSAIAELVSKSVSGLYLDNIRIVDSKMNLYSISEEGTPQSADSQLALQNNVQSQLQQQIINLLSPVFGRDNVLAEVNVKLNFDKQVSESVEYTAPQGGTEGLIVSMKELVEAISDSSSSANGSGVAGIDANGNASQYLSTLESDPNAVYYDISREVNYEINQTTTQIENAQGQIENLSVSVILNSTNVEDYADEVKQLVSSATGAAVDDITVQMLPFAGITSDESGEITTSIEIQQQIMSDTQSQQTMRLVIMIVAGIVVLIILVSIIKMFKPQRLEAESVPGGFDFVADEQFMPEPPGGKTEAKDINFDNKDTNLSVLEDYVDKNPESVANLLRNWLNEE